MPIPPVVVRTGLLVLALAVVGCGQQAPLAPATPATSPTVVAPAPSPGSVQNQPPTWDLDARGVPRFIADDYIDLEAIAQISRFRSSAGHSYTDEFESCRSMKHYFKPRGGIDWSRVAITSPVSGTIVRTHPDSFGLQIAIQPTDYPAFNVVLFHVNPQISTADGAPAQAGQTIGTHIGTETYSDIAISVNTPRGYALVSWFDVITEGLFGRYQARGLATPGDAIISRSQRDAAPLTCNGETFASSDPLDAWITLR